LKLHTSTVIIRGLRLFEERLGFLLTPGFFIY
jgi:hypothetical protein